MLALFLLKNMIYLEEMNARRNKSPPPPPEKNTHKKTEHRNWIPGMDTEGGPAG